MIEAPGASPTTKRVRFGGSMNLCGDHQKPNMAADCTTAISWEVSRSSSLKAARRVTRWGKALQAAPSCRQFVGDPCPKCDPARVKDLICDGQI